MEGALHHCKEDAQTILKQKFKEDEVDVISFNLVEAITKAEL